MHFGANFALTAIDAPLEHCSPLLVAVCLILVAARPAFWFGSSISVGAGARSAAEAPRAD
jgi:hypothetical protein